MRQTCLCDFLSRECPHKPALLRLPLSIRQKIYQYAGVRIDGEIIIVREVADRWFNVTAPLRAICRQIRREVEELVFSRNTVSLEEASPDLGLKFLATISPYACSQMRDLYVGLIANDNSYPTYQEWEKAQRDHWGMVKLLWPRAVENLLRNVTPQRLRLCVVCDVDCILDDDREVEDILQPLRNARGVFSMLQLRLSDRRSWAAMEQAREVVIQAQAPPKDEPFRRQGSFNFFGLPRELRRNILEYTNLVVPDMKIEYSLDTGFRVPFTYCETFKAAYGTSHVIDCKAGPWFCSLTWGAYSPVCGHDGFSPLSLLLTSRAMFAEAIEVLYSSNRFILVPEPAEEHCVYTDESDRAAEWARYPSRLLKSNDFRSDHVTICFLDGLRPELLWYFRRLDIVFPALADESNMVEGSSGYMEWVKSIEILRNHANVSLLSLTVHVWTTPEDLDVSIIESNEEIPRFASYRVSKNTPRISLTRCYSCGPCYGHEYTTRWVSTRFPRRSRLG